MKKLVFSIFLIICTFSILNAQEKVTILTVNGYVHYFSGANNIGKRLLPGDILSPRGIIRCESDALAVLLFKGKKQKIEAGKELDLTQLAAEKATGNRMGYFGRFLSFIGSSVNNTEDNSKLEKYHQRYMANAKGGIRGWGQGSADIMTYKYLSESVGGEGMLFEWAANENYHGYTFEIREEENNTLFFKAFPRANAINLHLEQLNFLPGALYSWRVKALDTAGQEVSTAKILFSYEPDALADFLASKELARAMEKVEEGEKDLLLVYELEEKRFFYAAYSKYQDMIKQSPENDLYKRLFAAFLIRSENLTAAKEVLAIK